MGLFFFKQCIAIYDKLLFLSHVLVPSTIFTSIPSILTLHLRNNSNILSLKTLFFSLVFLLTLNLGILCHFVHVFTGSFSVRNQWHLS